VGYAAGVRSAEDNRKRVISLTEEGERQADKLQSVLARVDRAFEELFADMGVDLLADVERFEQAIEAKPLTERLGD
jgi:DNA-binding MarR family transcriptional regulator